MARTLLAAWLLVAACERPATGPAQARASTDYVAETAADAEPLEYVEALCAGAQDGDRVPTVLAFHGRGGTPERFAEIFSALDVPARVIALRAPIDEGDGRAWFVFRHGGERAVADLRALVPRALATLDRYEAAHPEHGPAIATGFSQGGMVAYELALAAPRRFAAVFPISAVRLGSPPTRVPEGFPPIRAFHGARDPIIALSAHEEDVEAFRLAGADATLTRIEDAPHWITAPMREAVFSQIRQSFAGTPD